MVPMFLTCMKDGVSTHWSRKLEKSYSGGGVGRGEENEFDFEDAACEVLSEESKWSCQVPGAHMGDLEWKHRCMSHLHLRGLPGIEISLRHASSTLSDLKIIFFDGENGEVGESDVLSSSSSLLLPRPRCSSSPSSSCIIICSHHTIWTRPGGCPSSSVCSNSYLLQRAFFFNFPWPF